MKICWIEVYLFNKEQLKRDYEIYNNKPEKLSYNGLNELNNLVGNIY